MFSSRGVVLFVGAAGAAIAGLVYGVEEFVLLAMAVGVLLTLGGLTLWYRRRLARRSLRVTVRVPASEVSAGQQALVELLVANEGRHRLAPLAVEEPRRHWSVSHPGLIERRPGTAGARPVASARPADGRLDGRRRPTARQRARARRMVGRSFRIPDLPPGADAALWIPVPTTTRGLLTLDAVGLWCEDPLRLFASRVTVAPPAHVLVYPVPAPLERAVTLAGARHTDQRRLGVPSGRTTSGDELSGLRPYEPGDRLSRLHWPALARTGDLVVREFVDADVGSLTLLVDLRPSVHAGHSVDAAVSRAAGLGLEALRQGASVELCTSAGDRVLVTPGAAGRLTLLRALAMVGPAVPPPSVVRRWGARAGDGAVWATGRVDGGTATLVTTTAGVARPSLPASLLGRVETVAVP